MGDNIVHFHPGLPQMGSPLLHLLQRRHFTFPPFSGSLVHLLFRALPSAEGKEGFFLYGKNLSAHQVVHVFIELMNASAVPFLHRVLLQQVKVFMCAVHKRNGIFFLSQFFQELFLLFPAFPQHAEIAADYQGIPLFQPACRRTEAANIPMDVPCYVDH